MESMAVNARGLKQTRGVLAAVTVSADANVRHVHVGAGIGDRDGVVAIGALLGRMRRVVKP